MSFPSERSPRLSQHLVAAGQHDVSWLVRIHGQADRSLTLVEVVDAYNERLIDPETYVWTDGMRTWQQLQAVDAIVDALHREAAKDEASTDAHPEPAPAAPTSSTRDESAMFSLASLMSGAAPSSSPELKSDDSGIIDLAALTRAAPLSTPSPALLATDLFGAPLDTTSAALPAAALAAPPKKEQRVVAALIAMVAILSAALVFKVVASEPTGSPSTEPSSTTPTESKAPTQEVSTSVLPSESPRAASASDADAATGTATAAPSTSAPASATPATSPLAAAPSVRSPQPPHVRTQPAAATPPAKPPPATTGACPCKPDDLQCHMRCAMR